MLVSSIFWQIQVMAEQLTLLDSLKEHIYNPLTDLQSAYKVVMVSCSVVLHRFLGGAVFYLSWGRGGEVYGRARSNWL